MKKAFTRVHHCDIVYDYQFDEYSDLPYWILFTAKVCIIHDIRNSKSNQQTVDPQCQKCFGIYAKFCTFQHFVRNSGFHTTSSISL